MKMISLASVAIAAVLGVSVSIASAITFKADEQDAATLNGNVLKGPNKTYGKGVLKADQVKTCVALAAKANALDKEVHAQKQEVHSSVASLNAESTALNKLNTDISEKKASLDARTAALNDEKDHVDASDAGAVAAFKAKAAAIDADKTALNASIQDFNERVTKLKAAQGASGNVDVAGFNDKVKQLNKQLDEFDDQCADKDYYADDYAAAKAALKR